jgi:hypothetical protein
VLKAPETKHQKEVGILLDTASFKSVSEGEEVPTPSDDLRGAAGRKEEIPLNIKSTSANEGTHLKGTWSDKMERAKGEGMETDLSPS